MTWHPHPVTAVTPVTPVTPVTAVTPVCCGHISINLA